MKFLVVLALTVAVALAAPANPDADAQVVSQSSDNIGVGDYNAQYQTSNGISASEQGQLTNVGTENEALVVRGVYQYVGLDGKTYSVSWTADENGFQPQGDHLPRPQ